ncbi:MAG TPA: thioesterase family protein [Blastococcus sp.]
MSTVWSSPVRFVECDQQGIVFNAHYLVWADEAVTTWWDRREVDWADLNARGFEYVVVASSLEWRSSARWRDSVEVDAELEKLGRTSVTVRFVIRAGERECCVVRTTYVCTSGGTSTPWPDEVRNQLADG